jgi:hypothetical protein
MTVFKAVSVMNEINQSGTNKDHNKLTEMRIIAHVHTSYVNYECSTFIFQGISFPESKSISNSVDKKLNLLKTRSLTSQFQISLYAGVPRRAIWKISNMILLAGRSSLNWK